MILIFYDEDDECILYADDTYLVYVGDDLSILEQHINENGPSMLPQLQHFQIQIDYMEYNRLICQQT